MCTAVCVDGFNLYYIRLKGQRYFRWLNLKALADDILKSPHAVTVVNYYTAYVWHKEDPGAPGRQRSYLNALGTVPEIKIHFGNFLYSEKWAALTQPPQRRPAEYAGPPPQRHPVGESKGSSGVVTIITRLAMILSCLALGANRCR
jgi:hypothetical protein